MVNEKWIRNVLDSYELSERLKSKLFGIAFLRIDKLNINSFEGYYGYIAHLVDQFSTPWIEKHALRLDSLLKDTEQKVHDIISTEDNSLQNIIEDEPDEEYKQNKNIILTPDIFNSFKGEFEDDTYAFICKLLELNKSELKLDPNTFLSSIIDSKEKIKFLFKKFGNINNLLDILKSRKIVYIQSNPFNIHLGRRRYNGNPLAYFREHKQCYESMTRQQLAKYDSGLHNALSDCNQLQIAIPYSATTLSENDIKKIMDSYETAKAVPFKAEKITGFDHKTIKKVWHKFNLEIPSETIKEKIINLYSICNGNASRASKIARISITTILKYWRKEGLSIRKPCYQKDIDYNYSYIPPLKEERRKEIIPLYYKYNRSASMASKHSNYSTQTILNYWKEAGFKIRPHGG
ncbi:hypothetical protein J4404_00825 [Candidatus Woesearchaeota archaeon]|nr:hypothetical protein [Candidatus Woesearchaeota archaeon]